MDSIKRRINKVRYSPTNPKHPNPYAHQTPSMPAHPTPSAIATKPFQRPNAPQNQEQEDYLAEARRLAGRDPTTGKKVGYSPSTISRQSQRPINPKEEESGDYLAEPREPVRPNRASGKSRIIEPGYEGQDSGVGSSTDRVLSEVAF
ncbi:hypothetical protein GQ43DRAFT_279408 [Delitschia confertaspora ATCC 74209]|uniref:Uncharacterized protein n=1 Tax=Delitschia confertaspora ATCC 74209 TaxID=1513339 RepID=A0A9P4MU41_9PLEO|nr:hypothetical protein GQ43DRAFT_279408 [Delitschia confertaspora ATCC 74209]